MSISYEAILADLDPSKWRWTMTRQYQEAQYQAGKSHAGEPCKPGWSEARTGCVPKGEAEREGPKKEERLQAAADVYHMAGTGPVTARERGLLKNVLTDSGFSGGEADVHLDSLLGRPGALARLGRFAQNAKLAAKHLEHKLIAPMEASLRKEGYSERAAKNIIKAAIVAKFLPYGSVAAVAAIVAGPAAALAIPAVLPLIPGLVDVGLIFTGAKYGHRAVSAAMRLFKGGA